MKNVAQQAKTLFDQVALNGKGLTVVSEIPNGYIVSTAQGQKFEVECVTEKENLVDKGKVTNVFMRLTKINEPNFKGPSQSNTRFLGEVKGW